MGALIRRFITTKLRIQDFSYDRARAAAEFSLKRLGTDYIDLLLLHQPMGDYISAWRGLEALYKEDLRDLFHNPILTRIGGQYGNAAAQVALHSNIQRGAVVIPKTIHEERLKENFDVFDFSLSQEDMEEVKGLDIGHSEIVNHFDPQWIKTLHTVRF